MPSSPVASRGCEAFPSVIAVAADLAAEDPVRPCGVGEDQRYDHGGADQHEELARCRCRSVPDRDRARNDVGEYADPEPDKAKQEQCERDQEWPPLGAAAQTPEEAGCSDDDEQRHLRRE